MFLFYIYALYIHGAQVKLGQTFHRTDVCPKTLNPVWDSPWFKFSVSSDLTYSSPLVHLSTCNVQVNDEDLQDEPLQIKYVHVHYSAIIFIHAWNNNYVYIQNVYYSMVLSVLKHCYSLSLLLPPPSLTPHIQTDGL